MMKKVALFGGAFDPPHFGHGVAIRQLLDMRGFDEIWVIPDGVRREKELVAGSRERCDMVRVLIRALFSQEERRVINVKMHRVRNPGAFPYTIREVEFLQRVYPDRVFTIAIGMDELKRLSTWHDHQRLFTRVDFMVVASRRETAVVPEGCRATIANASGAIAVDLSSTELRHRLRASRRSITGLTPLSVVDYIKKHKLYQPEA